MPEAPLRKVKKGESLWEIAKKELGDGRRWKEIFEANKERIDDPNLIRAGQKLLIPKGAVERRMQGKVSSLRAMDGSAASSRGMPVLSQSKPSTNTQQESLMGQSIDNFSEQPEDGLRSTERELFSNPLVQRNVMQAIQRKLQKATQPFADARGFKDRNREKKNWEIVRDSLSEKLSNLDLGDFKF